MENVGTVVQYLKDIWTPRANEIEDMYSLRRLKDDREREGYESVVSNRPRVLIRLGVHLLSGSPMIHSLAVADDSNAEKAGACERALSALWGELDRTRVSLGKRPWRVEVSDNFLMTGFYAVVVMVKRLPDGTPQFIAEPWNPGMTYPEWDADGLARVAYSYQLPVAAAYSRGKALGWTLPENLERQGILKGRKAVTVDLLWERQDDRAVQSVLVEGTVAVERRDSGYATIPVLVGVAGGEGIWGGYNGKDGAWAQYYAQSFLAPNKSLFDTYNRWLTYQMQAARDSSVGAILHTGGVGGSVTEDDIKSGRIVDLETNEGLSPMTRPVIPPQMETVRQELGGLLEEGGFTRAMLNTFGSPPPSGFALKQMLVSALSAVGEYHQAMNSLIGQIDTAWLAEFRDGKFRKPVTLSVRRTAVPGLKRENFTPELVPQDFTVEATSRLAAPDDRMERLAAARQAMPQGNILDRATILEEIIEVQDRTLIERRLDRQDAAETPEAKAVRMVKALRHIEKDLKEGLEPDPELAADINAAWHNIIAQLGGAKTPQQGPQIGAPEQFGSPEAMGKPRSLGAALLETPPPQAMGGATAGGPQPTAMGMGGA